MEIKRIADRWTEQKLGFCHCIFLALTFVGRNLMLMLACICIINSLHGLAVNEHLSSPRFER